MSAAPPPTAGRGAAVGDWLPRWHPATLAAYAWARLAAGLLHLRWRSRAVGGGARTKRAAGRWVLPAPPLPERARYGVLAALSHSGSRCLAHAMVLRAWERAHGTDRALIIGVTAPGGPGGFRAHAWLEGDDACHSDGYTELSRR